MTVTSWSQRLSRHLATRVSSLSSLVAPHGQRAVVYTLTYLNTLYETFRESPVRGAFLERGDDPQDHFQSAIYLGDLVAVRRYLEQIDRVFDTSSLLSDGVDHSSVVDYYSRSAYAYELIHSKEGAVHMALNFDGRFDEAGYCGQPRIVQQHIDQIRPAAVLELASGRGFNSIHLASSNPDVSFTGVDITPPFLDAAEHRSRSIRNLRFLQANYQDLPFPDESFDLVFVVESLCYAADMCRALGEACRVLKPHARFIVLDGFRNHRFPSAPTEMQTAARLVEYCFALDRFVPLDEWFGLAEQAGMSVLNVDDLTEAILPTMLRLQPYARRYFKYATLGKLILKLLPKELVMNSIGALLMPFTFAPATGVHQYCLAVLKRNRD